MLQQFKKTLAILLLIFFAVSMAATAASARGDGPMGSPGDHHNNHFKWDGQHMWWRDGDNQFRFDGHYWWDDKHQWKWDGIYWWDKDGHLWDMKDKKWY
jgi:hypothetical protein